MTVLRRLLWPGPAARRWRAVFSAAALSACAAAATAGPVLCGAPPAPDLAAQRRLLQVSAALRTVLQRFPDAEVALVARDGTDLRRWGIRHTHAGLLMRHHPAGAWTVRQLYYDCEAAAPQVFDQGLAGFLHGSREAGRGAVALTLLPGRAGAVLAATALKQRNALRLLHDRYSANAHAFSTRYQNCNQWVAEMMALAWGGAHTRSDAQAWLQAAGYRAQAVTVGWRGWLWLSRLSPWLRLDDHPEQDLDAGRLRISLPEAMAEWLAERHPDAVRLQACWRDDRLLWRRGGPALADECEPQAGDETVWLHE